MWSKNTLLSTTWNKKYLEYILRLSHSALNTNKMTKRLSWTKIEIYIANELFAFDYYFHISLDAIISYKI